MELTLFPKHKRLKAEVKELKQQMIELRESSLNINWNLYENTFGSSAGVTVNKNSSLTLSAYYAGLNILCDTLNIPISVYKREPDGDKIPVTSKDAYEYQVFRLLHVSPSQLHIPSEWIRLMEFSRVHEGNGVSVILNDRLGIPTALKYVAQQYIEYRFDGVALHYTFHDEKGNVIMRDVPHWQVIHVKGFSKDGVLGVPLLDFAKESMSFGKATQVTGNKYFEDGMLNKVVLTHPGHLKEIGEKNLKTSFDDKLKGKGTVVLEEGIKVTPLSITNEQSQFLQSREFGVTEMSRWLNIPEFMLANNDPTYSNIENFANHFITHNVRPRVRMYEQEFNWKLLGNSPDYFTEFNMDALVRADLKTQSEYFKAATGGNSWMTRNEIRSLKNMNKDTGGRGDLFLEPLNAASEQEREMSNEQGNENI